MRYNLEAAKDKGYGTLITFGGAYSNHIAATAAAGKEFGFRTIGIIRGDELAKNFESIVNSNPTSLTFKVTTICYYNTIEERLQTLQHKKAPGK